MSARLDFKHEICAPDNESTFEAYRNEDPFSYAFDVRITTVTETLELCHLTHNQMAVNYKKWIAEHKCSINPYEPVDSC